MESLDLNGKWRIMASGEHKSINAVVPGCVHLDLLACGKIDDPYYGANELDMQWIAKTGWTYTRTFGVPARLLQHERVLLRCEGLDTLAHLCINGQEIGRTDNMFRTWEFDIKPWLCSGRNQIEVRFDAPVPFVLDQEKKRPLPAWALGGQNVCGGWLRKEPCNFGWDWGPILTTCGIWRDIKIVAFDVARLTDVHIRQDHSMQNQVNLTIRAMIEKTGRKTMCALVRVLFEGRVLTENTFHFRGSAAEGQILVKNPRLWWPNGLGEQPLYEVMVQLIGPGQEILDTTTKRIGLRTLHLDRNKDRWGESFQFVANGISFFAKGANWIPADTFAPRVTAAQYDHLLSSAVASNFNMLRVWGGGIYESDTFYDRCDELGICVWQDFMFACSTYPVFNRSFRENVKAEAEDNVCRLRHHPCIALWCGNNELEQGLVSEKWANQTMSWRDYSKLFDVLLPEVVQRLDGDSSYWPCSPHSPIGEREDWKNPKWGDAHIWDVWGLEMPFEFYRESSHRFVSEFGFQSFSEPKTVYGFTGPEDRNITSFVMEHHQRSGSGNTRIMQYMCDWFRFPNSFEMTLWLSQILQGVAIKYAVEHWRRNMPRTMGALYWQLNDCWPAASWSSIDCHGRWKALHYFAKRFYAPILISGVENLGKGTVDIHTTSDLPRAEKGKVTWTLMDLSGTKVASGNVPVHVPALKNELVETLHLEEYLESRGQRNLLLWLELRIKGQVVSSDAVIFARPKHLSLMDPKISTTLLEADDGRFVVQLKAEKPALWTWLALKNEDAIFSDNFLHLWPGKPVQVMVTPSEKLSAEMLQRRLVVRSLVNTYTGS